MTAGRALTAALCALLVLPRLGGAQGLATAPERGCRPDSAAADTTGDSLFVWLPGRAPDQAPAEYDTQLAEERVALAKVAPLPPLGHRDRLPRPTLEYTPGAEWLRDASTLVWFQVRPDGRLSGLYLYSSSGWVALDLALERAVLRADSQRAFLPLPPALGGDPVNLWLAAGIGRTPFGLSVPLTRVRHATAPLPRCR